LLTGQAKGLPRGRNGPGVITPGANTAGSSTAETVALVATAMSSAMAPMQDIVKIFATDLVARNAPQTPRCSCRACPYTPWSCHSAHDKDQDETPELPLADRDHRRGRCALSPAPAFGDEVAAFVQDFVAANPGQDTPDWVTKLNDLAYTADVISTEYVTPLALATLLAIKLGTAIRIKRFASVWHECLEKKRLSL
jgi:hypothetical protein